MLGEKGIAIFITTSTISINLKYPISMLTLLHS